MDYFIMDALFGYYSMSLQSYELWLYSAIRIKSYTPRIAWAF